MAITAISRDWGVNPSIVRVTTTDDLAVITVAGYVTAQLPNIELINNGDFEWVAGDFVAIVYGDGQGFFTYDPINFTFVAEAIVPGSLTDVLANGHIFVGNAGNVATGVAVTGVLAITNAGVTSLANGSVLLAALSAGIAPSHVVKFAAQYTTVGGAAAEAIAIAGLLATDLVYIQLKAPGTNTVTVHFAVPTTNTLTVTFSADPGNNAIIYYQVLRAAA